jgi:hypothetical protein
MKKKRPARRKHPEKRKRPARRAGNKFRRLP